MKGKCNSKIENRQAATHQHRTESLIAVTHAMRKTDKGSAA